MMVAVENISPDFSTQPNAGDCEDHNIQQTIL